ncbi:Holliday junction DNA helicase RuvA [Mycobacteroides abscessus subsp. bolletii]|uniref:Holliday junction branch migration protein RuvA n=1 Tax=Mycobacteroides abscessus TaxID=36809 RepID=UPI0009A66535|nr:Holliday junction branch migration protein RuvA [Mycobacteroides abscessus]SKU36400.1 Holliday junction DNA helicase RuvA [Mycobacteroides abscessus subsp. bolletii]
MIASVNGEVIDIALDHVVIEAAGVGYRVNATPATLSTLRRGTQIRLITAMIVREDSMTLYGFTDTDARDLFTTLLGVSGVGPKIAMATLAVYDAPTLRQALADGDVAALTRVPGIGKRGAERLVLELREKVAAAPGGTTELGRGTASPVRSQVVEALIGLGFAAKQAEQATDTVLAQDNPGDTGADVSGVLRSALALLGKTR